MALRLENKVALITGGASGIGRATAIRFAEEGADLALADRALGGAEEVALQVRKLGRKAIAIQVDTGDEAQVAAMVARTVKELGALDIVVAAAGISHARYGEEGLPPQQMTIDKPLADWRKVLSVNLDGVFLTCRAAAATMMEQGKGGRIITIASAAAKYPLPGAAEYCASKAGVWMLSKVMAVELAENKITVNAIGPGWIDTPMTADIQKDAAFAESLAGVPLGHVGEAIDVANTALFLASEEGRYYTGSMLHPDGGLLMW
jgi:NAD(P)-dependent dehydrogenase (short-subunit alcohol dehydrogenase family)